MITAALILGRSMVPYEVKQKLGNVFEHTDFRISYSVYLTALHWFDSWLNNAGWLWRKPSSQKRNCKNVTELFKMQDAVIDHWASDPSYEYFIHSALHIFESN